MTATSEPMAKKKKAPEAPKDQHSSRFMVRLPEAYRVRLRKLTERTRRTLTTEIQIALDKHFAEEKID